MPVRSASGQASVWQEFRIRACCGCGCGHEHPGFYNANLSVPGLVDTLRSHPESPRLQAALRDLMRVLSAVVRPDATHAILMVTNEPIPAFRHETLLQLPQEARTEEAIDKLASIGADLTGSSFSIWCRAARCFPRSAAMVQPPHQRCRSAAEGGRFNREGVEALYLSPGYDVLRHITHHDIVHA